MKKLKYSAENSPQAWLYLLPALIIILVFHVYPLIKTFIISFEKGTLNNLVFNGIRNYQIVLSDPKFHKAILNTTLYSFTVVPIGVVIAMIISLIIFEKIKRVAGKDIIAVIISSVFFGVFHFFSGNLVQMVMTACIGAFFCFCRLKIKNCSTLSLIIGHGVYDALITVFASAFL